MKFRERLYRSLMSGNFTKNVLLFLPRRIFKLIKNIIGIVDFCIQACARQQFGKNIKVQKNKILFITSQGAYTCNQAAIAREILRQKLPYELIFTVNKQNRNVLNIMQEFPSEVKVVERGSYEFFEEAASSKILIDNSINLEVLNVRKKAEQVWIQTWHGSLGLKKMDKKYVRDKKWVIRAISSGKKTDYCISNSEFETNMVFKPNYWKKCEILEYGHPRNDIFFDPDRVEKVKHKVRKFFDIKDNKKILLYAPTFRDNQKLKYYDIDFEKLKLALSEKFGGEWVILLRLHYKLRNLANELQLINGIIDATDYCNMQDLIATCDIGVTDYSSWICDLVLTTKPGFIYASDFERYNHERGLVYPISETPFPVAENNTELVNNIINFDSKLYEEKRAEFLKLRGCIEDGNASKRVVDKIKEIIDSSD